MMCIGGDDPISKPLHFARRGDYNATTSPHFPALSRQANLCMRRSASLVIAGLSSLLVACSVSPRSSIESNEFLSTDMYSRSLPGSSDAACDAARRALLSQGYVIRDAGSSQLNAIKKFQPVADRHEQVEFHIVCALNSNGSNSSTVFANAVRDTYTLRKSSNSASIGVGGVGSLSLPFGLSDDSLVKVGSETIQARLFYDRFFEMVERYVDANPPAASDAAAEMR